MQGDIQARGFELTRPIRRTIERTAISDLGRFSDQIAYWKVRVFDLNGPRGGADKACRVHVRLRRGPELVITDAQDDLYTAIGSAFARLGYAMGRQLDRYSRHSRQSIRHSPDDLAA